MGAKIDVGHIRDAAKSAIIWSVASDVYRFHGRAEQLEISTSCPEHMSCLYVLTTVASKRTKRSVSWNLAGTSATGLDSVLGEKEHGAYIDIALCEGARALLEHVEEALGCGPRPQLPEKTDQRSLCYRAIAILMRQRLLWDGVPVPLRADSATIESDGPVPFAKTFPQLAREVSAARQQQLVADIANRIWDLKTPERAIALDVATAEAVEPGGTRTSLWDLYESRGRDVWSVVSWLDKRL